MNVLTYLCCHVGGGRHRGLVVVTMRGSGRVCRDGVRFFARVVRRVEAPLALVLTPLRGIVESAKDVKRTVPRLLIVRHGKGQLLDLIGRLVSFHGMRSKKVGIALISISVGTVLTTIYRHFSLSTRLGGIGVMLAVPSTTYCTGMSPRTFAGVIDGLLAGTLGFAISRV